MHMLTFHSPLCAVPPAKESALLFPDGGFYRGEINAQLQRHGQGSMHAADGVQLHCGEWVDDVLQPSEGAAPR